MPMPPSATQLSLMSSRIASFSLTHVTWIIEPLWNVLRLAQPPNLAFLISPTKQFQLPLNHCCPCWFRQSSAWLWPFALQQRESDAERVQPLPTADARPQDCKFLGHSVPTPERTLTKPNSASKAQLSNPIYINLNI